MNVVTAYGFLSKDAFVKENDGKVYARVVLAVQRDYNNKTGKKDADFLNCYANDVQARFIRDFANEKGTPIMIEAKVRTKTKDKVFYTNFEIINIKKPATKDMFTKEVSDDTVIDKTINPDIINFADGDTLDDKMPF